MEGGGRKGQIKHLSVYGCYTLSVDIIITRKKQNRNSKNLDGYREGFESEDIPLRGYVTLVSEKLLFPGHNNTTTGLS